MRKKQRRFVTIMLSLIGLALLILVLNTMDQSNIFGGNWDVITGNFIDYFPQLAGISLGFVLLIKDGGHSSTTSARLMLLTSVIGVVFASLFYEMYNDGIWIDEIITATYTITDFQFTVVLSFFILGILLGLLKRR